MTTPREPSGFSLPMLCTSAHTARAARRLGRGGQRRRRARRAVASGWFRLRRAHKARVTRHDATSMPAAAWTSGK
eukprot:6649787-Prymnesium_polylepis.2